MFAQRHERILPHYRGIKMYENSTRSFWGKYFISVNENNLCDYDEGIIYTFKPNNEYIF